MGPVVVSSVNETRIREQIVRCGASVFTRGLMLGSSGNICLRLGGWLVTPTNASLRFVDPTSISGLDSKGNLSPAISRRKRFLALYETVKQFQAVVHLRSTHAVALSMLPDVDAKAVLPAMTPFYLMRAGRTALLAYFRPGDLPSLTLSNDWEASTLGCCLPITVHS